MKIPFFGGAVVLALASLTFFACKKEKREDVLANIAALRAQAQTEQSMAAIMDVVQEQISQIHALNSDLPVLPASTCPTINSSGTTFPMTITLDFGNGCTTPKGHQMAGQIDIVVSGKTDVVGATLDVKVTNFAVDGNLASGQIQLVTAGASGQAQQDLMLKVTNFQVVAANGTSILVEELNGTRTQVGGKNTVPKLSGKAALLDDVFEMAFEGKGVDSDNKPFSLKTTNALVRQYDCQYIVSGIIVYESGIAPKTANYGDGNCDNTLEVTAAGVTKTIELP